MIVDIDKLDFSKTDSIFVDLNGNQEPIYNDTSSYALCTHSMVDGYYYTHDKYSSGACKVTVYNAQRCKKCGYLANAVYHSSYSYAKCPH